VTAPVWDEERVRRWLGKLEGLESELAPVSDVLFDAAQLKTGMDVLDVGCGAGSTTRRAADLVGPGGSVTGLDISPAMIDAARRLAGDRPIRWVATDIVADGLPAAAFDVVLSRFGVMFFTDRLAAFTRLAEATRPGGRLCLAVWRLPGQVPLFDVPLTAVTSALRAEGITFAEPPAIASSLGDQESTGSLLQAAGWSDVAFQTSDLPLYLNGPGSLDTVVEEAFDQGPLRMVMQDQPESAFDIARTALREALAPLHDGTGVPLPGGFMVVTAVRR
jgi:SAM-dependent methyltransferase